MKNIFIKLADEVLSKNEMKALKGSYSGGTCTAHTCWENVDCLYMSCDGSCVNNKCKIVL